MKMSWVSAKAEMNQTEIILNRLIEEIDLAIIKAKAQLEYIEIEESQK